MDHDDRLDTLLQFAQQALDDPGLSGDDLAAQAHLSRFHFDRIVSAAGGEPPGSLRRRLLLERAAYRLVHDAQCIVLDVAVEAGYGSHEAFTRAFARAYGRTPLQTRHNPPPTFRGLELAAPSGVHFQPPGGLRLPAPRKETGMDVIQQLVDHHVDSLTAVIGSARHLPDETLDRSIALSVEGIDDDPTLRGLLNGMVTQEEHWLSALRGGDWPDESDRSIAGLTRRHEVAGASFRTFVASAIEDSTMADTFIDTTCNDLATHTIGGTIAHVITFGAVRRTMAVGALWSAGIRDFDRADPRPWIDSLAGAGDQSSARERR
ncbi:helix-turn-helix domain-containing protein [Leekyejoonella antrihumi]|uniref:Helix-turn-helix transcriptional regulator n=1 Tax=Leekyejoonella antrihumi TaxID=1660198 RepID=A0A563E0Z8_9MICO|nr:AraC family transcriptional regulator [Leekyejoonella antrihumi]TWP36210.1 helix-turn-helix transcriptional regulator [Leekyejoonella antrihumi]